MAHNHAAMSDDWRRNAAAIENPPHNHDWLWAIMLVAVTGAGTALLAVLRFADAFGRTAPENSMVPASQG